MTKIIIAGDSYGLGEWTIGTKISHPGINQYFNDYGYQVINCCGGGFSLEESFWALRQCLDQCLGNNHQHNPLILWIQTDPSRSLNFESLNQDLIKFAGLKNLLNNIVQDNYAQLNTLAQQHDTVIHAIGGLYDLIVDPSYSNINFLVKSWIGLLMQSQLPKLFAQHFGIVKNTNIQDLDLKQFEFELSEKIIEEFCSWRENSKVLNYPCFNDGFHPNRHSHKILFDYIVDKLSLENLQDQNCQKL